MKSSKPMITNAQLMRWWFPALVVTIILLGTFLVALPQINLFNENRASLKKIKSELTKAQEKVDQVNQIDVEQLDRLTQLSLQALPEHKPYYEVLLTLQNLAIETGISLDDFKLDPGLLATGSSQKKAATKQDFVKLSTNLSISGTTESVSVFVEKLQLALPLVTTTSISIDRPNNEGGVDYRKAELSLDLFYDETIEDTGKISLEPLPVLTETHMGVLDALSQYTARTDELYPSNSIPDYERVNPFSF